MLSFLGLCGRKIIEKSKKIIFDRKFSESFAIKRRKPGITQKTASKNINSSLRKKLHKFLTIFWILAQLLNEKIIENH